MASSQPAVSTPVAAPSSTPAPSSTGPVVATSTTPTTPASVPAATTPTTSTTPVPTPTSQSSPTTTPLSTSPPLVSPTTTTPLSASTPTTTTSPTTSTTPSTTPSTSHTPPLLPTPSPTHSTAPPVPLPTEPPPRLPVSTAVIASLAAVVFIILLAVAYRFLRSCRSRRNKPPLPPPRPPIPQYPYPPLQPPSTLFANDYERKSFYESGSFASLVAQQQRYSVSNPNMGGMRRDTRGSWTPSRGSAGESSTELTALDEVHPGAGAGTEADPTESEQSDVGPPRPPPSSSAYTDEAPMPDSPRSPDPLLASHAYVLDAYAAGAEPAAIVLPPGSPSTSPRPLSSHPSRTSIHSSSTTTDPAGSSGSSSQPYPPPPPHRAGRQPSEHSHAYAPSVASSHTRASVYSAHTLHPPPPMPLPYRGAPHAPHMRARMETVMPEPLSRSNSPYGGVGATTAEQQQYARGRYPSVYGQVRASVYGGMGMGGPPAPPPHQSGYERGRSMYGSVGPYDEREARQRHRSTPMPPGYSSPRPSSVASSQHTQPRASTTHRDGTPDPPPTPTRARKPSRLMEMDGELVESPTGEHDGDEYRPPPMEEEKDEMGGVEMPVVPRVGEVEV